MKLTHPTEPGERDISTQWSKGDDDEDEKLPWWAHGGRVGAWQWSEELCWNAALSSHPSAPVELCLHLGAPLTAALQNYINKGQSSYCVQETPAWKQLDSTLNIAENTFVCTVTKYTFCKIFITFYNSSITIFLTWGSMMSTHFNILSTEK